MLFFMKLPQKLQAWTAIAPGKELKLQEFTIKPLASTEVAIAVEYCGVCHSDLHLIDNDWEISKYPLVPGHEIMGKVIAIGSQVKNTPIGAVVGVGWQRSSCGHCYECKTGHDNMCNESHATCIGHRGGFADIHITEENYCFIMPELLQRPEAAPLLCGGITVYSPLREFLRGKKDPTVGIVGMGGLGHLAIKFAHAMGAKVAVFSSSLDKKNDAINFGASEFVITKNPDEIAKIGRKLDLVLVTANVDLPWDEYLKTLRVDGTLCFVGIPPSPYILDIGRILGKRLRISSSPIGSRKEIEEMLNFANIHQVLATIEQSPMENIKQILQRMKKNQVHYRAVCKISR